MSNPTIICSNCKKADFILTNGVCECLCGCRLVEIVWEDDAVNDTD